MKRARALLPACAVALAAVALSACGNAIPGNAVAMVEDEGPITKERFDKWARIAAASLRPPAPQGQRQPPVVVPTPPDFTACVRQLRAQTPTPRGQRPTPDDQLRQQCRQQYEALRDEVMQFLLSAQWIEGEAQEQGVEVSQREVDQQFAQERNASFPNEKAYRQFLRDFGYSEEDIKFRVRLTILQQKIVKKLTEGNEVTDQQIREYYQRNRDRFSKPERRDLRVVLTEERGEAEEAKQALEDGESFSSVAREFSIDPATKGEGGVLLAQSRESLEQSLAKAVFSAEQGQLTGPVRTQFGYYLFRVQRVIPAEQQPLERAAGSIRQLLTQQRSQKTLERFVKEYEERWSERTDCREGFVVQSCSNAPEQPEGQQAPPGGVPPGGQPQQVPPGGGGAPPGGAPQQVPVPPQGAPPDGGGAPQQVPVPPQQAPPGG
ncbi:MAG TPA: peptidyl-prolyl cis-trans isomerase [Solirubrobacteraceae bacterium]|nr:peptidyl-prolyl cis-trans isomerase [Solirubrobacteraceae bacterium]